jgi:hypothetical protein
VWKPRWADPAEQAGRVRALARPFRAEEDHPMAHALTVVALFANRENAEQAVSRLVRASFPPEHVGYLEPGREEDRNENQR